jgi:hypothetical protein
MNNISYTINQGDINKDNFIYPENYDKSNSTQITNDERNNLRKQFNKQNNISYEDILTKINRHIINQSQQQIQQIQQQGQGQRQGQIQGQGQGQRQAQGQIQGQNIKQEEIYNNNNNNNNNPIILIPRTKEEYHKMVLEQAILNHNKKVHLLNTKSKKLVMPTENINISRNILPKNYNFNLK